MYGTEIMFIPQFKKDGQQPDLLPVLVCVFIQL